MEEDKPFIVPKPVQSVRSFKVFVCVDREWVSNGMRFPNSTEAERYAEDLSARWTKVESYDIQPSDEEPNAQMLRFGRYEKAADHSAPQGSA